MNAMVDATGPLSGARWPNRFRTLGTDFFTPLPPQGVPDPYWVAWSPECAELLGLAPLAVGVLALLEFDTAQAGTANRATL
mgnify:CR=1 FL=1